MSAHRLPEEKALRVLENHIGPTNAWPEWMREVAARDHLGVKDRFVL